MKVSTDACIQGAWGGAWLRNNKPGAAVLDIGTGTGLLSLMLTQLHPESHIDAIELNEDAFWQAERNFENSPWKNNLRVFNQSVQSFAAENPSKQYDFAICNPPFFHNHLQAQQIARNDARHSIVLSKEDLATALVTLLKDTGNCCIMYPATEWAAWLNVATVNGLNPVAVLEVKPKATVRANRMIGIFSKNNHEHSLSETLVIYDDDKQYTPGFKALLQPYYLAL